MFASIDEAVEYWKDELSYVDDAKVTGYVGGYPVVEFTINKAAWGLVKDKKKFGRIVRSSEMEGRNRSRCVDMLLSDGIPGVGATCPQGVRIS